MCKEKNRWVYVITAVYFFVILMVFGSFIGKDDAGIRSTVGNYDGHCTFVTYTFGWLVSRLYMLIPIINWYTIIIVAPYILFMIVLLKNITASYTSRSKGLVIGFILIMYTILIMPLFVKINFTYVSGLYILSGVILLLHYKQDERNIKSWSIYLFFLIGYLIRLEVFFMALPFIGIIVIYKLFQKDITISLSSTKKIILCLGVFLITVCINFSGYSHGVWRQYMQNEDNRAIICDYYGWPDYEEYKTVYNKFGVYEKEKNLLDANIYMIDGVDVEKLIEECGRIQIEKYKNEISLKKIKECIMNFYGFWLLPECVILNLFTISFCIAMIVSMGNRTNVTQKEYLVIAGCICIAILEILYLLWNGRVIYRAVWGVQVFLMCIVGCICNRKTFRSMDKSEKWPVVVVLGMLLGFFMVHSLYNCWETSNEEKKHYEVLESIDEYCGNNKETMYFSTTRYGLYDNSNKLLYEKKADNIMSLGLESRGVLAKQQLEQRNIYNLVQALSEEKAYIIVTQGNNTSNQLKALMDFILEDYPEANWKQIEVHTEWEVLSLELQ